MPKQDKKKKGSRNTATRYVKKHKDSLGRVVEQTRVKKGPSPIAKACASGDMVALTKAILGFDARRVVLECGQDYTSLEDKLEVFRPCTKPKGHDGFHGHGNGLPFDA